MPAGRPASVKVHSAGSAHLVHICEPRKHDTTARNLHIQHTSKLFLIFWTDKQFSQEFIPAVSTI